MDSDTDKATFGLALTSGVAILGGILKLMSNRLRRSSCFGMSIEMESINQQLSELQNTINTLTQENLDLKRRISNAGNPNAETLC